MVNFEWYRTFKVVYETKSLTAAAKLLFISQPNVSQHISALEAQIGKTLFERKHKITPTDYAKVIYAQIVEPVEKLEAVESSFNNLCKSDEHHSVTVGTAKEYLHLFATDRLKDFPGTVISKFGQPQELLRKLPNCEINFVLCTEKDNTLNLKYDPIMEEELWVIGSTDIDMRGFEDIEQFLLQQNWLSYGPELTEIRAFWGNNFKKRPAIVPNAIIPDFQTMLQIITKGNMVAVLSNIMAKELLDTGQAQVIWKGYHVIPTILYLSYDGSKTTQSAVNVMKQLFSGLNRQL